VALFLSRSLYLAPSSEQERRFCHAHGVTQKALVVVWCYSFPLGRLAITSEFLTKLRATKNRRAICTDYYLVALLAQVRTYALALSMALGAFLVGMMLSESQYRHQ